MVGAERKRNRKAGRLPEQAGFRKRQGADASDAAGARPWWFRWAPPFLLSVCFHIGLLLAALLVVFEVWRDASMLQFRMLFPEQATPQEYNENRIRDVVRSPVAGPEEEVERAVIELNQECARPEVPRGVSFDHLSNKNLDSGGYIDAYGVGGGRSGCYGARWGHGALVAKGGVGGRRWVCGTESVRLWQRSVYEPAVRVTVGPNATLKLVRMNVLVEIEGPRARTIVDHIFYNPYNRNLEGHFEYNLPTGASVCYYAMFLGAGEALRFFRDTQYAALRRLLKKGFSPKKYAKLAGRSGMWGELREAKVVPRESAVEAYERIVRRGVDPAVLRRGAENKFKGRVFPIRPHAYNRIILAYEQTLPFVQEHLVYRFCFPKSPDAEGLEISVFAARQNYTAYSFKITGDVEEKRRGTGRELLYASLSGKKKSVVTLLLKPVNPRMHVAAGTYSDGKRYFYARLYPYVPLEGKEPHPHRAVFVLDASLSESPDRFGIAVRLAEAILEADSDLRQFAVLLFDVGARWVRIGDSFWVENNENGRSAFRKALDGVLLEGASDLAAALSAIAAASRKHPSKLPVNIHLFTNGYITWGRDDVETILRRFWRECRWDTRFFCYRTGVGAENIDLLRRLTMRGGGLFNCMSRDAIKSAAAAHNRRCLLIRELRVEGAEDVLVAGGVAAVYPNGSLEVVGRATSQTVNITITGTLNGRQLVQKFTLRVKGETRLAARAWAQVAIAHLEALHDPHLRRYITALAQQFNLSSRYTNFLILETDRDYKVYDVDISRRVLNGADIAGYLRCRRSRGARFLPANMRLEEAIHYLIKKKRFTKTGFFKRISGLLEEDDFEPPRLDLSGDILRESDVPKAYLLAIKDKTRESGVYIDEARRRWEIGHAGEAVRALSCIMELHRGSNEATRCVAYELLRLGLPEFALMLYLQLLGLRPFDAQLWRECALAATQAKRWFLAALLFEVVTQTRWRRFRSSMRIIALAEYEAMLKKALGAGDFSDATRKAFAEKLKQVRQLYRKHFGSGVSSRADLRVTIFWNTDNSDVDLWVIEPTGEKCFYQHRKTRMGGVLLDDVQDGYGPERYELKRAQPGTYRIMVHYYSASPTAINSRTQVTVLVQKYAGSQKEQVKRFVVTLDRAKQAVEVCRVHFE